MDFLHHSGIDVIQIVQSVFGDKERFMLAMSRAGDPKNAFLYYFPVVYCLSAYHGRRLMLVGVVSEWLNIMFKWILFGHRPYWWVHENDHTARGEVEQYPLTCETGPGSPSGHAMVTAAVYYVIADACSSKMPKWIPFSLFWIALIPINVARIFIATHFPHQVVAGTICGVVIAVMLDRCTDISKWDLMQYFKVSAALFSGCVGFTLVLGQLGVDLHWTFPLAYKWCKNPDEWVSLNTAPYNSLVRDVSVLVGFGASEALTKSLRINLPSPTKTWKLIHCLTSLAVVNILETFNCASCSALLFYAFSAFKHTLIPFIVVFLVPYILSTSSKERLPRKSE